MTGMRAHIVVPIFRVKAFRVFMDYGVLLIFSQPPAEVCLTDLPGTIQVSRSR